jgi:photoactive yellow protein
MKINEETEHSGFTEIRLSDLDALSKGQTDMLTFGVIGLNQDGIVEVYNAAEAGLARLDQDRMLGTHFFSFAQCMNNSMVAQRFELESVLDTVIDFTLTLRMRPTPVKLRLLKEPGILRRYILVQRL